MRILVISADLFEDSELTEPVEALRQDAIGVDIASLEAGTIRGKRGAEVAANLAVRDAEVADYDMLLLPGGKAPAQLRESAEVIQLVQAFVEAGKPVAAICHGPQILISAGLVKGRTMTSYKAVADELKEAGAHYVDQMVVIDSNFITSRQPSDLPAFIEQIKVTLRQIATAA